MQHIGVRNTNPVCSINSSHEDQSFYVLPYILGIFRCFELIVKNIGGIMLVYSSEGDGARHFGERSVGFAETIRQDCSRKRCRCAC